jgi:hypothetical protein
VPNPAKFVQQPSIEVINLWQQALALTIPPAVLQQADRVIH